MSEHADSALRKASEEKLRRFDRLRGKEVRPGQFWDLVIVTAADEEQRAAYEVQISEKLCRNELPLGIPYQVFADPPGPKIGNGGSTLYSFSHLEKKYGETLSSLRVILIHAGSGCLVQAHWGRSSWPCPFGDPLYQMLELKLAMYVDFPARMRPGVLVTCADDIELYSVSEDVEFNKPGFTALAHPSALSIGTTHGVFVLEPEERSEVNEMEYRLCVQFLHKPSIDEMQKSGAVCKRKQGTCREEEFVYTDSTYYMDYSTVLKLLGMLEEIGPLDCEIDAYGDFLQALGSGASIEYTNNTVNVTKRENSLVEVRQKIFYHLRGIPLNVVVLNKSKFYHIGTSEEYLLHFTGQSGLREELGLLHAAFTLCECSVGCVMHSVVHPSSVVSAGSVVEYSRIGSSVTVGHGSIVSGCWINAGLTVPPRTFMHTLAVNLNGQAGFVTVAFGTNDNLKNTVASPADLSGLVLFGTSLLECVERVGLCPESVRFSGEKLACSLWNLCLFPVCSDLQSSSSKSLEVVQALCSGSGFTLAKDTRLVSLQESLQNKSHEEMLKFRRKLYRDIVKEK
uniref:GDP-fucose pyrophosphorylase domain-containing protein n=1 Tax=Denticeps clupeoides TaxID=299321 RepID=A0AAY4BE73_9TELE